MKNFNPLFFSGAGNLLSAVSFASHRYAKGCRCDQGWDLS